MHFSTLVSTAFALFSTTGWAGYVLEDDYFALGFFEQFSFWDTTDPTWGFVDYLGESDALNAGLLSNSSSNAKMMVDSTNNTPNGRPSVRITSNKAYSSGLVVIDVEHMPGGICGTWPAFWMVGPNWPYGGEIDIIEGVNDQAANDVTLHTGPGCSVNNAGDFLGTMVSTTCTSSGDNNQGCGIASSDDKSYGAGFNDNNGGVYAMEWTSSGISVHFFARGSVPSDVLGDSPNPSSWGTPMAAFTGACGFETAFTNLQIVFDMTFCGAWAGQVWNSGSCASQAATCNDFVQNNPSAFADSYWSINALKVYQQGSSAAPQSTQVVSSTSIAWVPQPTTTSTTSTTPVAPSPTTFAVQTTSSPAWAPIVGQSGTIGAAEASDVPSSPVVGGDGSVGNEGDKEATAAPAPVSTPTSAPTQQSSGGFFTTSDGAVGWNGKRDGDDEEEVAIAAAAAETKKRHLAHVKRHMRHGPGRL